MDYETLLAFAGLFILLVGSFYYEVRLTKRVIKLEEAIGEVVIQMTKQLEQVKNELVEEKWGRRK